MLPRIIAALVTGLLVGVASIATAILVSGDEEPSCPW